MESQSTFPSQVHSALWEMIPSETIVREIYSALANTDSYRIFRLASDGIDASSEVLEEQSFSKKRYYVRLRKLIQLGLVRKDSGKYVHTNLGRLVHEATKQLEFQIARHDQTRSAQQAD